MAQVLKKIHADALSTGTGNNGDNKPNINADKIPRGGVGTAGSVGANHFTGVATGDRLFSYTPVSGDPDDTVATKGYADGLLSGRQMWRSFNMRIENSGNTITIKYKALTLEDGDGNIVSIGNTTSGDTTLTLDPSNTGANGLSSDYTYNKVNTWYDIYVISKAAGADPAAFAVEAAVAGSDSATLPTDYTHRRFIGVFKTESTLVSSVGYPQTFTQIGNEFMFREWQTATGGGSNDYRVSLTGGSVQTLNMILSCYPYATKSRVLARGETTGTSSSRKNFAASPWSFTTTDVDTNNYIPKLITYKTDAAEYPQHEFSFSPFWTASTFSNVTLYAYDQDSYDFKLFCTSFEIPSIP